jgi:predicted ester cyclase
MVAEDDKVAVRLNWKGTHLGPFMDIIPTGNKIDIATSNTVRIVDGKWVELWNVSDSLRFMQQIGAIPPK